jgi:hypothetical protein
VFNAFAPKKEMQLYNRGVLATMLANDMQPRSLRSRLEELLNKLAFVKSLDLGQANSAA